MLCLTMRRGPTPGAIYDLEADEVTIGRGNKNNIVIRDNEVSRDHCRLVRVTDSYEVYDLNSSNGTFVNGQRVVTPWLLQSGAVIELGDTITLEYAPQIPDTKPLVDKTPDELEISASYSLMMIKGPAVGYVYPLESPAIAIGRDLSNDIVIQDPEVSRFHLRLHFDQNTYMVEDLKTTNGTFINGEQVRENRCLEANDVLKLGTIVQLQYVFREEADDANDDTPVSRPPELMLDKDPTLANVFKSDLNRRTISSRNTGLEPGVLLDHLMIVYAREDWETVVAPLMVRLQDTRLNAWVDQYLILGGEIWRAAVEQALTECWLMVFVVSDEALRSNHIKLMYRYFLNQEKPIIPLLRDSSQTLPGELNRLRSIIYEPENSARSFHKLIFEIMQLHQQS